MESERNPIDEFEEFLNTVFGVFIDSRYGYQLQQKKIIKDAEDQGWDSPMYYGDGPEDSVSVVDHTATRGERIARNAREGDNCRFIGNMCLVYIYSFWEHQYRQAIAEFLGLEDGKIALDIFGDIRLYRHSIIHTRGIATEEIEKCKVLKWFLEGDEIFLTEPMFRDVVSRIREALGNLKARYNQEN